MLKPTICLALAAAFSSVPTHAQQQVVGASLPTARVSYEGLNLRSAAGVEVLNNRVRRAAERLCRDRSDRDLRRINAGRRCLRQTVAAALPQIELAVVGAGLDSKVAAADRAVTVSLRR